MDYTDRWHIIVDEFGEGGQGKVSIVLDKEKVDIETVRENFLELFKKLSASIPPSRGEIKWWAFDLFRRVMLDIVDMGRPKNHGALKVLHKPEDAVDAELSEARIRDEITAMSDISHPNLLEILDSDPDSKWFVSKFLEKGTLTDNQGLFMGDFVSALKAFRPLVEGVAKVHKNKLVHRDIKPENVFLDSDGNLVLGDFGLVFFDDPPRTRYSKTFEKVGSTDWMPGWAMTVRIEEIKPAFDVFCLGKLLWAMVSKKPKLPLWYFDHEEFNLKTMFLDAPYIELANRLFKKCIVQFEKDCLPNAGALLEEVDKAISIINKDADLLDDNIERACKVCGIGTYRQIISQNNLELREFGITPTGNRTFKVFTCSHCGHVQLFDFGELKTPPAWEAEVS